MKHLLVLLLLLCSMSISAQDVIVKKDGSTVVCRVVEVTATEIAYKKWNDLNGSNYVMDKSLASAINYQSGKRETFSETESLYKPNNQNDGVQAMNDKALLRLDYEASNSYKKVKRLRKIGWIGGGVLCVAGIIGLKAYNDTNTDKEKTLETSIALLGTSAAWTTTFLLIANHQKKKIENQFLDTFIFRQEFKFSNGTTISAGIDLLSDHTDTEQLFGNNTLGLGLRFNF